MLEAKFIASGASFDDLKQAEKLDELLWEIPKELLLPHQLAHKINLDEPIQIGYPGTKFSTNSDSLINISPDMPNTLEHYETYYQLVIMDGAELRRKAADTWSECKKIGLTPEFLDQI